MRKINYTILVLSLLLTGCLDLDLEPQDTFDNTVLEDEDASNLLLNGAYARLTGYGYYGRSFVYISDLVSDDAEYLPGRTTFTERIELEALSFGPDHPYFADVYSNAFSSINACNILLDAWQEGRAASAKGQAQFLRALNYFNLVRLFGGVPLLTTLKGIPFEELENLKRASLDAVYDQILLDLNDIVDNDLLPIVWESPDEGRATKWAAEMLLSKVYLTLASPGTRYTGDKAQFWAEAAAHAKNVIDGSPHALMEDYLDLWLIANEYNSPEIMFAIGANGISAAQGGVPGRYYRSYEPIDQGINDGWGNNIPDWSLFKAFDDDDYRKEVGFLTYFIAKDTLTRKSNISSEEQFFVEGDSVPYDFWTPEIIKRPHLKKFYHDPKAIGNYEANEDGINFIVMRYAELLLIYAEAVNEVSGATPDAYEALNKVRRRAYRQPINAASGFDIAAGLDQNAFRKKVWEERRKELHQEAIRWFDLVRWDTFVDVMQAIGRDNVAEHHRYFPIPQIERDINPSLTQNPGY